MQKLPPIKYFKNLDGLRFFAALAVVIGHTQYVTHQYQGYYPYTPWANKLATFGVDFFFVLSGFLISYLLFQEIERTGRVNILAFYRRRMLRIFPLYFAVGLIGIIAGPYLIKLFQYNQFFDQKYADYQYQFSDFLKNLGFLSSFTVNFQTLLGYHNPVSSFSVGHLWSLAVEEQFYLIWAPAVYFFRKYLPLVILSCVGLGLLFHVLPAFLFTRFYEFQYYFTINRFWYFGLGAALAWLIQYWSVKRCIEMFLPSFPTNWLRSGIYLVQLLVLLIGMNYLFGAYYDKNTIFLCNGVVALVIIIAAISDISIFSVLQLENKVLKYLGNISYGIYMFHLIAIYSAYYLLKKAGLPELSWQFYFLLPALATLFAVALAAFSYRFLEERFLKMKKTIGSSN